MNYQRIYDQFIEDRRKKENEVKEDYYEKHHIVPRSLGGTNQKKNIICLTPEDHIRAHVMLAKIHGGKMWAAVFSIVGNITRQNRIPTRKCMKFHALSRKKFAEANKGKGNPFYGKKHSQELINKLSDQNTYTLKHRTGKTVTGKRKDICKKTALKTNHISSLLMKTKNSIHGWYVPKYFSDFPEPQKAIREKWRQKQKKIKLYHMNGEVFHGYPVDAPVNVYTFYKSKGNKYPNKQIKGWFLTEEMRDNYSEYRKEKNMLAVKSRGDISGLNNPKADKNIYRWENIETQEIMECTRVQAWKHGPLTKTGVQSVMDKRQTKTGGWRFLGKV